jgi:hypothetical protein
MKDSKNLNDLKNTAMAGNQSNSGASSKKEGSFKLYHLILMAVMGMMLGAYLQTTMFKQ